MTVIEPAHFQADAVTQKHLHRLAIRHHLQGALVLHPRKATRSYHPIPAYIPKPPVLEIFGVHTQLLSGNCREEHNRR